MPFSFNSLPTTDAGATVASVAGQSPAVSGLLPSSGATPSDASFDNCLTQAKQTPGITVPGKKPATTNAAVETKDATAKSEVATTTEGETDAPQTTEPTTSQTTATVDPLTALNNLLGLIAPPPAPPVDAPTEGTMESAPSGAEAEQPNPPMADTTGTATPTSEANAFSKGARFVKTRGTPKAINADQASTGLPAARIPKGIKNDPSSPASTQAIADTQTAAVPLVSDPAQAAADLTASSTRPTLARGLKTQTSKSLGRMVSADTNGALPVTLSATPASAATTAGSAEAAPVSNSVRSLRAMQFSTAPVAPADALALGTALSPAALAGAQAAVAAAAAATPTAAVKANDATVSASPTVRDLLASGAAVIDYTVSPDQTLTLRAPKSGESRKSGFSLGGPTDGTAAVTPTQDLTSVAPVTADSKPETMSSGALAPEMIPVADTQTAVAASATAIAPRFDATNPPAIAPQAKIAVATDNRVSSPVSGDKSSTRTRKNNILVADNKEVTPGTAGVGTDTAKRVPVMSNNTPDQPENARPSDPFLSLAGLSSASAHSARSSAPDTAPANSTLTSHAAQAVREIRDISDGLWAIDRNSVEVRFNFTETEKLSVRVELRDGAVHTTFRTDSPELRDSLAQEWQSQAQAAGSDVRPYRVADPVFGSGASNSDQRGSFSGGDASRQQQRSFEQAAGNGSLSFSSSRNSSSATVSAPNSAQRNLKTDTSIHLNAFA